MILGADVSTYPEQLQNGARFFDGGRPVDPLDAMRENGVSCLRVRLWNDPYAADGSAYLGGGCDYDNLRELARLAADKGFDLMLDFHYSDFWTDPAKQITPKAWAGFDLDRLATAVYEYTRDVLLKLRADGFSPAYIQVGNEITNGMLWPLGRLEGEKTRENYDNLCRLLSAGCRACREVCSGAEIVLHLERSHDAAVYAEFFGEMARHGVDYDIIGASYYPYWHGSFSQFFANMDACAVYKKKRMAVETGYGFTLDGYRQDGRTARLVLDRGSADSLGFPLPYPTTPAGQAQFVRDFLDGAREHRLDGVFYWEPLWLPGENICWASPAGQAYIGEIGKSTANEWANQCLFDYEGEKLPAFNEFSLRGCR